MNKRGWKNPEEKSPSIVMNSSFTANYVATGQTLVYIANTLFNLLPSLKISDIFAAVLQPSGCLVVLWGGGGGSPSQGQSWLIAPQQPQHTHTNTYVETHAHTVVFLVVLELSWEERRINSNCDVWEPGLLRASLWSAEMLMVMLPALPLPAACAVQGSDSCHSHTTMQVFNFMKTATLKYRLCVLNHWGWWFTSPSAALASLWPCVRTVCCCVRNLKPPVMLYCLSGL